MGMVEQLRREVCNIWCYVARKKLHDVAQKQYSICYSEIYLSKFLTIHFFILHIINVYSDYNVKLSAKVSIYTFFKIKSTLFAF